MSESIEAYKYLKGCQRWIVMQGVETYICVCPSRRNEEGEERSLGWVGKYQLSLEQCPLRDILLYASHFK